MELIKNIFFNTDKLIENESVKMSYTGKFFEEGAQRVFIHFGFGNSWENLSEIEMTKTELGFQADIKLLSSEGLNCCFRDADYNWDNNNSQNYCFNVEPNEEVCLVPVEEKELIVPNRKLRKSYMFVKKLKLAFYKVALYVPRLISGNYKQKLLNSGDDE